jgi:uncharacterized protein YciI
VKAGSLYLGGAFEEIDGGVFVFSDAGAAESFAVNDPYVTEELVESFNIRNVNMVVGTLHKHI